MLSFVTLNIVFFAGLIIGVTVVAFEREFVNKAKENEAFEKKHDFSPKHFILLLKGRRDSHRVKGNIHHIICMMLANGVLYVIVIMANGTNLLSFLYCLMTSAFLVISIVDFKTFTIPVECNVFICILGMAAFIYDMFSGLDKVWFHIIGAFSVSLALYVVYVLSKGALIGGGDIKLLAATGFMIGWKKVTIAFFLACIIGSVIHVIRMRVSKADKILAMGPYLCMGLWICTLWGEKLINWYIDLLRR